ncbi:tRNA (N6-threonylcarbamoyladenosine(37)-N6)-methyltransferase TrmO [Desulfosarcina ovata subsp. sediminis]|uniref:tRNA (N6-threonylcarbamoyladenosine(37)-N6)-methyltransferase TrmO n=2 Tax=Desulfosarcina ovata TaxID=83564 RepID=A0A5K7ZM81_9BACT|nr:tRNA (N6-threonylcarbamoyladenosine(37)-N6)-methyltransferase TrmO [Desulfosarcina ovata subsp. sediminis]
MENEMMTMPAMQLTPIGVVRSPIKTPMLSADEAGLSLTDRMENIKIYHRQVENAVVEVVIDAAYAELLDGIEGFSHVLVLYWPHLIDPARRNLKKVHPMGRKDLPRQGIFATCSPARPNPVLVSAVPLVAREKNVITVKGLEAVDGSPVVDLKPYSKAYMQTEGVKMPAWMEQIHREMEAD